MFWDDDHRDNLSHLYDDYFLDTWGDVYEGCGMNADDAMWNLINTYDDEY